MIVNWVLENIKKNKNSNDYYVDSKLNILLLLASVHLWKKNHPEDTCILNGDNLTIDTLDRLKVLDFFDRVLLLPKSNRNINKDVFWAASKLEVLSNIDYPTIIMDNDTHVYRRIKDFLDLDIHYVCNFEKGKGYYPTAIDPKVRELSYKTRWKTESVNVGFLNLPNSDFTRRYANESLKMMEEFSTMGVPHSQYLIFAEQLLLKHLFVKENIEHRSIISTTWDCKKWEWGEDHDKGVWSIYESEVYFKHYGPLKGWIKDNKADQNYEREMSHLYNCINFPNLDLTSIPLK